MFLTGGRDLGTLGGSEIEHQDLLASCPEPLGLKPERSAPKVLPPLLDPDCTSNFKRAEWGTRKDGTRTSKPDSDDHSSPCSVILSKSLNFSISLPIKWSY